MAHRCSCGDLHSEEELGVRYSLHERIDKDNVECLNETVEGSGATVFKPWEERLNKDKFVESDVDDELLFNIPFTGSMKLKGMILIGGEDGYCPNKARLFKNREGMTFDDAKIEPEQEIELCKDESGLHEYPLKVAKFSSVHQLSIHLTGGNPGQDKTRVYYIGFKGEWAPYHYHGVTICTYEARPQVTDHQKEFDSPGKAVS